ncbi:MAG: hypothetical protein QM626_04045 [Microbacterium sp.]|uniref:hypothetical protein n=1 Tax=Microbacterium sp. TaxID=51671 RepID=UPI0039E4B78E
MRNPLTGDAAFLTWRNAVVAGVAGPVLVFFAIAVGVSDQSFDSIAGPGGFVLLTVASAAISSVVFAVTAVVTSLITAAILAVAGFRPANIWGRVIVVVLLSAQCYLFFRLPTFKPQILAEVVLSVALALLLRPKRRNRSDVP